MSSQRVKFGGTFRSRTSEDFYDLFRRIKEKEMWSVNVYPDDTMFLMIGHRCSGSCSSMFCHCRPMEKKLIPYPQTVNDEAMYALAKRVGEKVPGEANVHLSPRSMGAENSSFYSQKMRSAFFHDWHKK